MGRTEPILAIRAAARTLGIATVILVCVGCTSPAAQLSQVPSATDAPTPSSDESSPESSTEPSTAALVLRLLGGGEAGRVHMVTVLDDGRVITSGYDQLEGHNPPVERRLTAAGVELLRDELDATGLAETSADYSPVANPGVEPPGYGGAGPSLEVGLPDGGTAVITWFLFSDNPEQNYFAPQPEAEALDALAARLSTLEAWLPADVWADAGGVPYEPESYRVYIYSQQWGGSLDDLPVESATVSWPLVDGISVFGDTVESVVQDSGESDIPPVCRLVDAEEAMPLVEALEAAGGTPFMHSMIPGTTFQLGHRATSRLVTITLQPILPLDEASC